MSSSESQHKPTESKGNLRAISSSTLKQVQAFGIDLSLLSANLALTPLQRIRQHQRSLSLARVLDIDALIKSKEALGRPRDREAVLMLKAIRDMRSDD